MKKPTHFFSVLLTVLLALPVAAQTREVLEQKIPVTSFKSQAISNTELSKDQPNPQKSAATDTEEVHSRSVSEIERLAKMWGLTVADWQRYEAIKKGPRGFWSANLDPLTTLGVEATTDAERQRIAEIQVAMELTRAEKELAYQRAYDAAFLRRYGHVPMIGTSSTEGYSRIALFISTKCTKCDAAVQTLVKNNTPVDLYVLGTEGNDQAILDYATKLGISGQAVREKKITLNHDSGTLASLGGNPRQLPAAYRKNPVTGLWERGQ